MKITFGKRKSIWHYIKNYRFRSILLRNFVCIVLFMVVPMVFTIYGNYEKFEEEIDIKINQYNEELLLKSVIVMDNALSETMELTEEISRHTECRYLYQNSESDESYHKNVKKVQERLGECLYHYSYIESIYLYFSSNQVVLEADNFCSVKDLKGNSKWYQVYRKFPMYNPYILAGENNEIMLCVPFLQESGERAGICVVNVDVDLIGNRLEQEEVKSNQVFMMMDAAGQKVYSSKGISAEQLKAYEKFAGRERKETESLILEGRYVISTSQSSYEGLNYTLISSLDTYTDERAKVYRFLWTSIVTGLLPSVVAAYFISVITYKPIKRILNVVEKQGTYMNDSDTDQNEVLYITSNILKTIESGEKAQQELERRIQSLKIAQSLALQFQVDPHFLYNTLDIIKWTAVEDIGPGNRVSKMLSKVAKLYKIALEPNNMILSLKQELEFLRLYVDILEVRYSGRIHFEWQIDKALYDCRIIKLCVQPLLENAVKHGLKPLNYQGNIWIEAKAVDNQLYISVTNDGVEMQDEKIASMNEMFEKQNGLPNSSVGMMNVNERIKILYGDEYGIKVSKRNEGLRGMAFILIFPIQKG